MAQEWLSELESLTFYGYDYKVGSVVIYSVHKVRNYFVDNGVFFLINDILSYRYLLFIAKLRIKKYITFTRFMSNIFYSVLFNGEYSVWLFSSCQSFLLTTSKKTFNSYAEHNSA